MGKKYVEEKVEKLANKTLFFRVENTLFKKLV